ncbi:MAG: aminopeptidase P family protein [Chloroflexi bacterium]|nr:aminopeptidase P family protein [Chloroflexota bacterium]
MIQTRERLTALQTRMRQANVDLSAIGPTANMRYLLGFTPHPDERVCLLLVTQDAARIVVPTLNQEEVAAHTDLELVGWADADGPTDALRRAMATWPSPRVLAVDGPMRADFLLDLQNVVAPSQTISVDALIAPLRLRKSAQEIEALARAAGQADRAMQAAVNACQPGVTEASVAWAVETAFRQDGAEAVDFTLIASGPNGAYPHHHSGERRLQLGDAIIIDIGATLNGYKSDITRMVYLGEPPAEFRQAYAAVLDANERARAAVRPGVSAGEIDHIARSILESAGFGPFFTHRTGHGIGLEVHEPPWIMANNAMVLEEGMAFSIEPGVYFVGKSGVRIEDIVTVTGSGVRTLSGFDHSLVVKE